MEALEINQSESNFPVYTNQHAQPVETPSFMVKMLLTTSQKENQWYHRKNYTFEIRYFPQTESVEESYEMADKLYLLLHVLESLQIRATKYSVTVTDHSLHFEIEYNARYRAVEEGEVLTHLELQGGLKSV